MKHRYSYLLLSSLLFSCSGKPAEFKDQRKALSSLPKIDEALTQELKDKCLANVFSTDNGLYSPIGSTNTQMMMMMTASKRCMH